MNKKREIRWWWGRGGWCWHSRQRKPPEPSPDTCCTCLSLTQSSVPSSQPPPISSAGTTMQLAAQSQISYPFLGQSLSIKMSGQLQLLNESLITFSLSISVGTLVLVTLAPQVGFHNVCLFVCLFTIFLHPAVICFFVCLFLFCFFNNQLIKVFPYFKYFDGIMD